MIPNLSPFNEIRRNWAELFVKRLVEVIKCSI